MPTIDSEHVRIETDHHRADVIITRSEKKNSLSHEAVVDLTAAFRAVDDSEDIRAATLLGDGSVLCAGFDLEMMYESDVSALERLHEDFRELLDTIDTMTTPTVAGIKGAGIAGGFELTLPCDFRILDESAKFGIIEVELGIFPHQGSIQRLPRLVGLAKAKELVLTGEFIDPQEADRINLVTETRPREEVDDRARTLVDELTGKAPLGIEGALEVFNYPFDVPLEDGLDIEHRVAMNVYDTADRKEGFEAQLEGREADFSGE